jgi:hypothetical protein
MGKVILFCSINLQNPFYDIYLNMSEIKITNSFFIVVVPDNAMISMVTSRYVFYHTRTL